MILSIHLNHTHYIYTYIGSIWRAFQNSTKGNVVIKITNRKLSNANTMVLNGLEYRVEENIKQEQAILKYLTSNEKCVDSIVKFNDFVKRYDIQYIYNNNNMYNI